MIEPKFQLTKEVTESSNILFLKGDLDLSQAADMRSAIDPLVAEAGKKLVLNLRDLSYIDSTGIGVIVSILKARDALKAPFQVEAIPAKIQRLFDITGLSPFLTA
ncbi:STAS domain-containing protein [Paenibacillus eucommiae]|uniref:Anti-sigma factor antagonist n=1 Tax=Paenibacillus eucommiae TaxID=1355755 RepID=A0ABS4IN33_9BACL|nr:STAS domain-containing protein [Paenibacillus eucommiae]MBP1988972.1 anti-sigma B factor antagonist [Paenibacillus eucommiae]